MPNALIIVFLIGYLLKRVGSWGVLIAIFVYASMHGSYAILDSIMANGNATMVALHQHSRLDINLIGGVFIFGACGILFKRCFRSSKIISSPKRAFWYLAILVFVFFVVMSAGALNQLGTQESIAIVKEVVFPSLMWVCALIIAWALNNDAENFERYLKDIFFFGGILIVLMLFTGLYEIGSGIVWARTGEAQRASGMLFNPNVLGIWTSLVTIGLAYLFHSRVISKSVLAILMALVTICLTLSGSRSGLILTVSSLFFVPFLLSNNKDVSLLVMPKLDRWFPLLILSLLLTLFPLLLKWLSYHSDYFIWKILCANSIRFVSLPIEAIVVIERLLNISILSSYLYISPDTLESLQGRSQIEILSDNTFFAIYSVGGKLAILFWSLVWGYILSIGINRFRAGAGVNSSYALVSVMACLVSGLFLRSAELFPVWIFISLILGVSIRWWVLD